MIILEQKVWIMLAAISSAMTPGIPEGCSRQLNASHERSSLREGRVGGKNDHDGLGDELESRRYRI